MIECHGLDTPERVCFYEQDFYVLSNFSAFNLQWKGFTFPTSEHAYHWEKFVVGQFHLAEAVHRAPSAHEAFKIAEQNKAKRRPDWDAVKVGTMRNILRAKAEQHKYVRRKLLATGDRELVENSWRDDYWGWGPNRDGQNMLGKLWMEIRADHLQALHDSGQEIERALSSECCLGAHANNVQCSYPDCRTGRATPRVAEMQKLREEIERRAQQEQSAGQEIERAIGIKR